MTEWDSEKIETPMVIKVGSKYHMYYSGFKICDSGGAYQIGQATSTEGENFTEIEHDIFTYENNDWEEYEVRAPCVIQEGNIFKMWFAGTGDISLFLQPEFSVGIGYATFRGNCE